MRLILDASLELTKNDRNVLEYELQLLKVLFAGGAIFFMFGRSEKQFILEIFWGRVRSFSDELSLAILLTVGNNVDYFDALKRRTDTYVASINSADSKQDTRAMIGLAFAEMCGMENNVRAILLGSKFFNLAISAVKYYLDGAYIRNYAI